MILNDLSAWCSKAYADIGIDPGDFDLDSLDAVFVELTEQLYREEKAANEDAADMKDICRRRE